MARGLGVGRLLGYAQGKCRKCGRPFVGPGDRCPPCRDELRQRRKRKPR